MSIENKSIIETREVLLEDPSKIDELIGLYLDNIDKDNNYSIVARDNINESIEGIKAKDNSKGLLYGVGFGVSDDISTKGIKSSAGSLMLENYIPPFNATAVEKLINEDGVLLGKVKVKDFGLNTSKLSKAVKNKETKFILGTDGGSLTRKSAIHDGILSYKPSYGLVSRSGSIGLSSSLDQFSILANNVEDLAYVMDIIKGRDLKDSTSIEGPDISYIDSLSESNSKMKIGVIGKKENIGEVKEVLGDNLDLKELDLDFLDYNEEIYKVLMAGEAASNTAKFDGIRYGHRTKDYDDIDDLYKNSRKEGFSKEIKSLILFGNFVMSSQHYDKYYKKAQELRSILISSMEEVFENYDLILFADKVLDENYSYDKYSLLANLVGLPVIAMNLKGKLGVHIMADSFKDEKVFQLARKIESIL